MSKFVTATSLEKVKGIASGATATGAKFTAQLAALNAAIGKKREEISRNLEIAGLDKKGNDAQVATSMKNFLRDFRKETEAARYALFSDLNQAQEALSYARTELSEPKRMATSYMIGTEERSRLESQVEKLGLGSLASLAKKAVAESHTPEGKLLAVVCIAANDRVNPNSRPFDSFEIADKAFGAECAQVKALCKETQLQFDRVRALNKSFETGQDIPALEKTRLGLEHGGDALPHDAPLPREESIYDRMARGLPVDLKLASAA